MNSLKVQIVSPRKNLRVPNFLFFDLLVDFEIGTRIGVVFNPIFTFKCVGIKYPNNVELIGEILEIASSAQLQYGAEHHKIII